MNLFIARVSYAICRGHAQHLSSRNSVTVSYNRFLDLLAMKDVRFYSVATITLNAVTRVFQKRTITEPIFI